MQCPYGRIRDKHRIIKCDKLKARYYYVGEWQLHQYDLLKNAHEVAAVERKHAALKFPGENKSLTPHHSRGLARVLATRSPESPVKHNAERHARVTKQARIHLFCTSSFFSVVFLNIIFVPPLSLPLPPLFPPPPPPPPPFPTPSLSPPPNLPPLPLFFSSSSSSVALLPPAPPPLPPLPPFIDISSTALLNNEVRRPDEVRGYRIREMCGDTLFSTAADVKVGL